MVTPEFEPVVTIEGQTVVSVVSIESETMMTIESQAVVAFEGKPVVAIESQTVMAVVTKGQTVMMSINVDGMSDVGVGVDWDWDSDGDGHSLLNVNGDVLGEGSKHRLLDNDVLDDRSVNELQCLLLDNHRSRNVDGFRDIHGLDYIAGDVDGFFDGVRLLDNSQNGLLNNHGSNSSDCLVKDVQIVDMLGVRGQRVGPADRCGFDGHGSLGGGISASGLTSAIVSSGGGLGPAVRSSRFTAAVATRGHKTHNGSENKESHVEASI